MPAIRITGMASGLPPNIVDQIIEAERVPVKQMEVTKSKQEDKVKLVADLETRVRDVTKSLEDMVGIRGFSDYKLQSGDPNIIDGVADPTTAVNGQWQLEVVQLAQKPGAMSNGFPDKDKTQLGVGYLKFDTSAGEKEIYINGKNNTLEGVVAQINESTSGIRAQIITDRKDQENPFRLLVSGLTPGQDNQIKFPTVYLLDGDQDMYFDSSKPAKNAIVKLDGFEVELPDNQSKDLIPGVNIDLKQAAPGRQVQIKVKENLEVISGKIKTFVDAYNKALSFIQDQHKLQKDKDGKERMGPLGGDGMLRTIESGLRSAITSPQYGVDSDIKLINELGIEFTRNGILDLKADKFNATVAKNPKSVGNFLRGDGFQTGFVPTIKRQISNVLDGNYGPIPLRKRSLNEQIDQINKRIDTKEQQLTKREEGLRAKFADLEAKMSQLNVQQQAVGGIGAAMGGGKG